MIFSESEAADLFKAANRRFSSAARWWWYDTGNHLQLSDSSLPAMGALVQASRTDRLSRIAAIARNFRNAKKIDHISAKATS